MRFDPVSYAIGKLSSGGSGGGLPVVVGTVTGDYTDALEIPAPQGVDFSQYDRVALWLTGVGTSIEENKVLSLGFDDSISSFYAYLVGVDSETGESKIYSVGLEDAFSTNYVGIILDGGAFSASDYSFAVWKS